MSEWQCKRCGSTERYADGRCTPCGRAKGVRWQAANREKANAKSARWRAANPEKYRAAGAKWDAANPEKRLAHTLKWQAANRDKLRANSLSCNRRKQTAKSLARLFSFLDEMATQP